MGHLTWLEPDRHWDRVNRDSQVPGRGSRERALRGAALRSTSFFSTFQSSAPASCSTLATAGQGRGLSTYDRAPVGVGEQDQA